MHPNEASDERRIVLLGKTGSGKSSTGNIILTKEAFVIGNESTSATHQCESKKNSINAKNYVIIDTPGYYDTERSDEVMMPEIVRCITECSPGPHAFVIVLKVERYSVQEQDVVRKITKSFGEEAFKYALVLFTHGDQLQKDQTIEQFVEKNSVLKELVGKCGGSCHVIDNKYWNQEHEYRSNRVQVEKLLDTIEDIVRQNEGGCYTTEMLQAVEREIKDEVSFLKKSNNNLSDAEARNLGKRIVRFKIIAAGCTTGALLGALLGIPTVVGAGMCHLEGILKVLSRSVGVGRAKKGNTGLAGLAGTGAQGVARASYIEETGAETVKATWAAIRRAAGSGKVANATDKAALIVGGGIIVGGVIIGGVEGAKAAEDAKTLGEAVGKAYNAVVNIALRCYPKQ